MRWKHMMSRCFRDSFLMRPKLEQIVEALLPHPTQTCELLQSQSKT